MKKAPTGFIQLFCNETKQRCLPLYLHVENINGEYVVVGDHNGFQYVTGKELKGYLGDILCFQHNYSGDFFLMSDQHGMVCKWKNNIKMPKSIDEALDILCDALESI